MDNERKLRSEFRSALDDVLPPAPWLEAAVTEDLRKRRQSGSMDPGVARSPQRSLWLPRPAMQWAAALAVLLTLAIVAGLFAAGALRHSPPIPGATSPRHIYWVNSASGGGTTIGRAKIDGTAVDQQFITGASAPWDVAVDGSHIYWANHATGTIGRANLDGTGVAQRFITGAKGPSGMAVDGSYIYWSNGGPNGCAPSGTCDGSTIGRANLDGTGVNQSFITGASHPAKLAVDSNYIYWSNNYGSSIGRANLDGSGVNQRFIATYVPAGGIAVDHSYIYWRTASSIGRARLDGTGVNPHFVTAAKCWGAIAVDPTHIFWATRDDASCSFGGYAIGRANLDGTQVNESFITGADSPAGVAVDRP